MIDEAHQMLPAASEAVDLSLPSTLPAAIYVTVHSQAMRPAALVSVQTLIGVGPKASEIVESFCQAIDAQIPRLPPPSGEDQVLFWDRASGAPPRWINVDRPKAGASATHAKIR